MRNGGLWCQGSAAHSVRAARSLLNRKNSLSEVYVRGEPFLGSKQSVETCAASKVSCCTSTAAGSSECLVGGLEKLQAPDAALPPRKLLQRLDRSSGHVEEGTEAIEDDQWIDYESQCKSTSSTSSGCPVYVMLPLDTIWLVEKDGRNEAIIRKEKALELALHTFEQSGVEGVMVDVWWGIVERDGPKQYDFSAYKRLFRKISDSGLKIQAVMSFHSAGGNVGDTCKVPLPQWVLDVGAKDPDIFYTDKQRNRNQECLSLGCDSIPLFFGRTPVEMYRDFAAAFARTFHDQLGSVVTEITVGLGPAGELRYPAYPEGDGRWRFPGVGEFQCYDKYMLQDLEQCAKKAGHPEWAHGGPHDAGSYNSREWETGFFGNGGRFDSPYGHFFLSWYSGLLIDHGNRILSAVSTALHGTSGKKVLRSMKKRSSACWVHEFEAACQLGVKLAGVHWWFKTKSHAGELTAGYYNTYNHNGYDAIMDTLKRHGARLSFTCVEMRDCEHPPDACCSPQGLLEQVMESSQRKGVKLAGENALQRYDEYALSRIMESAYGDYARNGTMEQITFLRMADVMFDNWNTFQNFLVRMNSRAS